MVISLPRDPLMLNQLQSLSQDTFMDKGLVMDITLERGMLRLLLILNLLISTDAALAMDLDLDIVLERGLLMLSLLLYLILAFSTEQEAMGMATVLEREMLNQDTHMATASMDPTVTGTDTANSLERDPLIPILSPLPFLSLAFPTEATVSTDPLTAATEALATTLERDLLRLELNPVMPSEASAMDKDMATTLERGLLSLDLPMETLAMASVMVSDTMVKS